MPHGGRASDYRRRERGLIMNLDAIDDNTLYDYRWPELSERRGFNDANADMNEIDSLMEIEK